MRIFEHGVRLFDMHCHLGFADDVDAVRRCLDESGTHALSCTVTPAEYEQEREAFANVSACTVALGLHPWRLADGESGENALLRFEKLAATTRFIGEIGLDYAGERGSSEAREIQRNAFARALAACAAPSAFLRKLLSIHAVKATGDVLDLLEEHDAFARHDCIFHWFAGTPEELKRAIGAGCRFSMGPRMLATKRGREYARIVPVDRLLLETDSPSRPNEAWDGERWIASLESALTTIAELRGEPAEDLARAIARTSESLLKRA